MSMPFWPAFIICVGTLFCSFFPSSYVDFVYFLWQFNFLLFTFRGGNISCTFRSVSGPAFHNVSFLKNVRCFCEAVTNVVSTMWHPPPALPSPWIFSFPGLQGPCLAQFQLHPQQFLLRVAVSPGSHSAFTFHKLTGPTLRQYFQASWRLCAFPHNGFCRTPSSWRCHSQTGLLCFPVSTCGP